MTWRFFQEFLLAYFLLLAFSLLILLLVSLAGDLLWRLRQRRRLRGRWVREWRRL